MARLSPVDDTMCMSYVLDTGRVPRHNMDLLDRWLGHKTIKYEDVCGKGKSQIRFDQLSQKRHWIMRQRMQISRYASGTCLNHAWRVRVCPLFMNA